MGTQREPDRGHGAARSQPPTPRRADNGGRSGARRLPSPGLLTAGSSGLDAALALQRSAGNTAVARALDGLRRAEAEAPEPAAVQRSAVHDVLRAAGRPLDTGVRADMEARLGADFSTVRVHDDPAAARSASELGAAAYTSGEHVVLGQGGGDRHTLAHELSHVIQQRSGPVAGTDHGDGLRVSDPSDAFERAAEANAVRALRDPAPAQAAPVESAGGGAAQDHIQRSPAQWTGAREAVRRERPGVLRTRWRPVQEAVESYGSLQENDLEGRERALHRIEQAIDDWRRNGSGSAPKLRAVSDVEDLMTRERAELQELRRPPAPTAATAPMAIGGGQLHPFHQAEESDRGSSASTTPELTEDDRALSAIADRLNRTPELPPGIHIKAHYTKQANISSIHRTGLRPSRGRGGLGLPPERGGGPDRDYLYVLSGSNQSISNKVSQDGGERATGVVYAEGVPFGPDLTYNEGGALMYFGDAPPMRRFLDNGGRGPFSFALPLRPGRTLDALTEFINETAGTRLSTQDVMDQVQGHLFRTFGRLAMGVHMA